MPIATPAIPVNGGYNPAALPTEAGSDYHDALNHRVRPGGGLGARPGYRYSSAFGMASSTRNASRHRLMTFDGGDFVRIQGGRGFAIRDGWNQQIRNCTVVQVGGLPFPQDADGNPNPPHEFIGDRKLLYGCDTAFGVAGASVGKITCDAASTAPVLRDGTDSNDAATYCTFSFDVSATTSHYASYDIPYVIPESDNCLEFWVYYDGDDRLLPAGLFGLVIATGAGMTGTTATASINEVLRPKRWTQIVVDLGDRGGFDFVGASFGLQLQATPPTALYTSNAIALRLESISCGKRIRLNRVSANDRFHFNTINGRTYLGNERNALKMWDGADVMDATIQPPFLKPGISLSPTAGGSPTVYSDGTETITATATNPGEWITSAQTNFTTLSTPSVTAPQNLITDGSTFSNVSSAVSAMNLDVNDNPVSEGGGNYLQLTMTNYPTVGEVMAKSNINGTTGYNLQDALEFEVYLDFGIASGTDPSKVIFYTNQIRLDFYDTATSGGNKIFGVPLGVGFGTPAQFDATSGYLTGGLGFAIFASGTNQKYLKTWFKSRVTGLSGLALYASKAKRVEVVFASGGTDTATYDKDAILEGGSTWKMRIDSIKTMAATYAGDAAYKRLALIRNSGSSGSTVADAAIGVVAYKNIATVASITSSKAFQMRIRWNCTVPPPSGTTSLPADLFRLQFYTNDTATANAQLTGDYGLIRTPLRPNEWTTVTIEIPPSGVVPSAGSLESMAILLEKKLDAAFYTGNTARTQMWLEFTDIRLVDAGGAATDVPTIFRVAFSYYDPLRDRESGLSPFSDYITCPVGSAMRIEVSGSGPSGNAALDPYVANYPTDPDRFSKIRIYVNSPIWGRNGSNFPRFIRYDTFDYPAGAQFSRYISLLNGQNLADLAQKPEDEYDCKFIHGMVPACRTAATDGKRIALAGQSGYSVGTAITSVAGSPILEPGGDAEFDPYMIGRKIRFDNTSKNIEFTIIGAVKYRTYYLLIISDKFDAENNSWNMSLELPATSASGVNYTIYGDEQKMWFTALSTQGAHPYSVSPLLGDVECNLGNSDRVGALKSHGGILYAIGRTGYIPFQQIDTALDDQPQSGKAYIPTRKSATAGILAPQSFVAQADGVAHWIGPEATIMSGGISGFRQHPLAASVQPFLSGETGHISAEGARDAHGVYIESQDWAAWFFPEAS